MRRKLCAILLILLLAQVVLATEDNTQENFNNNPTSENFQQLKNPTPADFDRVQDPTVKDLQKLDNPTIGNFQKLDSTERGDYLSSNYRTDLAQEHIQTSANFNKAKDNAIAEKFFTESATNINANKEKFSQFAKSEGITISMKGDAKAFGKDGTLTGDNGNINIRQFKEDYDFEVAENGDIIIIDKSSKTHTFNGEIQQDTKTGNMQLEEGTIDGKHITNGQNLRLEEGRLHGNAKEFGGLTFVEETAITYDKEKNTLYIKDTTLQSVSQTANLIINGKNVYLQERTQLQIGTVGFRDGQAFVPKGNFAHINSIGIRGNREDDVNLFFDGRQHPESEKPYVSMNLRERNIVMDNLKGKSSFETIFLRGNPMLKVEEEDVAPIIKSFPFSRTTINNRENRDLIPEVIVEISGFENRAYVSIINGRKFVDIGRDETGEMKMDVAGAHAKFKEAGSSPMTVIVQDLQGNNLLGTENEPKKMIMSNFNELTTIPVSDEEVLITQGFTKFKVSERLYYNYDGSRSNLRGNSELSAKNVQSIEGRGTFEGKDPMEFLTAEQRESLIAKLGFVPDNIWKAEKIVIYDDATWDEENSGSGGFAQGSEFHIPVSTIESASDDTIYHENLHNYHFTISKGQIGGRFWDVDWEKKWKEGAQYGIDEGKIAGPANENYAEWQDGTRNPRYGFVKEYAANNKYEDFASNAPFMILEADTYSQLVNPNSEFYQQRMGNTYTDGQMTPERAKQWADSYLTKAVISRQVGAVNRDQYGQAIAGASPRDVLRINRDLGYISQEQYEKQLARQE